MPAFGGSACRGALKPSGRNGPAVAPRQASAFAHQCEEPAGSNPAAR